jgi:hypothetical protein
MGVFAKKIYKNGVLKVLLLRVFGAHCPLMAARCIPIGYTAGAWGTRTRDALGSLSPSRKSVIAPVLDFYASRWMWCGQRRAPRTTYSRLRMSPSIALPVLCRRYSSDCLWTDDDLQLESESDSKVVASMMDNNSPFLGGRVCNY